VVLQEEEDVVQVKRGLEEEEDVGKKKKEDSKE